MKGWIIIGILALAPNLWATYKGESLRVDMDCYEIINPKQDPANTEDYEEKCYPPSVIKIQNKRYKLDIDRFYKLYVKTEDANVTVGVFYNDQVVTKEAEGVLDDGEKIFDPGQIVNVEWRVHSLEINWQFHGLIVEKAVYDIKEKIGRNIYQVFKLAGKNSCSLGFVNELETARTLADKSDEIHCQ